MRSEDASPQVLSREAYDRLIESFPGWMALVWPKLPKLWSIGGIVVHGCKGSGLASMLNAIGG